MVAPTFPDTSLWLGAPKQEKLDAITKAITRANRLIGDLLDVARMEAGRLSVELTTVEVAPLVCECIEAHQMLAEARSLHLEAQRPDALPPIHADRERMLQILSNLLGNAIKFTPEGGRLTLRVDRAGGMVQVEVADTGPGIPPESLPHLFDPFWQVRKGGREGAGLGLASVKGLVEAHNGCLRVESTPGAGSTFSFTFPVAA